MLLFTRREGQSLILETSDGPIEVNLAYLHGEFARIGIDAPSSVGIVRKESSRPSDHEQESVEPGQEEERWWHHPEDTTS